MSVLAKPSLDADQFNFIMERQELEALVGNKVTSVVSAKQNELMEGLSSVLTAKFQLLEKNFAEKQSSLSNSQVMRLWSSTLGKYQFMRKSCEEQFNFNLALEEKFSDIDNGLSVLTEESLERAKTTVSEGKSLIHQRQRLLKLTDSSELGWKVVNEYQSNRLASDSEDELKIYKEEVQAERKAHKEQMKKLRSRKTFRARPYLAVSTISSQPQTSSKPAVATTTKPGLCWHCGNSGHWRFECEVL